MPEVVVATVASFEDPGKRVFDINGKEVGVFRLGSDFYAYENRCPHLQGPACQGILVPKTEESLTSDGHSTGRHFSDDTMHFACPWHGFEFNVRTGRHPTHSSYRLKPVPLKIINDAIVLTV